MDLKFVAVPRILFFRCSSPKLINRPTQNPFLCAPWRTFARGLTKEKTTGDDARSTFVLSPATNAVVPVLTTGHHSPFGFWSLLNAGFCILYTILF